MSSAATRAVPSVALPLVALPLVALPAALAAQATWESAGRAPTEFAPQLAVDPVQGGLLAFGSGPSLGPSNETWSFRGAAWQRRSPAWSPLGRAHHAMATDYGRRRVVLFGGLTSVLAPGGHVSETWEWDGTTWLTRSAGRACRG